MYLQLITKSNRLSIIYTSTNNKVFSIKSYDEIIYSISIIDTYNQFVYSISIMNTYNKSNKQMKHKPKRIKYKPKDN